MGFLKRDEDDQPVQAACAPQDALGIEAGIAVALAQAVRDAGGGRARQFGRDVVAVGQFDDAVRIGAEAAPGRYRPHVDYGCGFDLIV